MTPLFRSGVHLSGYSYAGAPADLFPTIAEVAEAAETSGFDALFVPDHVHQNNMGGGPTGPMFEAYGLLCALAARTSRVRLGTLVTAVTLRPPALLAKAVTSLDVVSGGRAILGLGAAWDGAESEAYGIPFPPLGTRMDVLEETLQLFQAMCGEQPASFAGRYTTVEGAYNHPLPVHGRVPVLVGGGGERRTLRLVAEHADAANVLAMDVTDLGPQRHKLDVLRRHCEAVGRDPAEITTTVSLVRPPDSVDDLVHVAEAVRAAGFHAVVVFSANRDADTVASWGQALQKALG